MRHKILNLEGDVENFYQFLKENMAHTAAEDLEDRVGLEFKTLKQKIWAKIGSEAKEFGADVGPEDSVSNAGSSIPVSSEAALVEIDLTVQREELRLKAQQADLEAQQRQTEFALLDAKLRAEQKKQAILSRSCSSNRAGSRASKASSAKSHLPQAVREQQQRVKQMPVCRDLGASGQPKLFSTPPGFYTKLCLDRDEGELGPPKVSPPPEMERQVPSVSHQDSFFEYQNCKTFLDKASLIGYDGNNSPFVFFKNRIKALIASCPFKSYRLTLLQAACVRTAAQIIANLVADTPGLSD